MLVHTRPAVGEGTAVALGPDQPVGRGRGLLEGQRRPPPRCALLRLHLLLVPLQLFLQHSLRLLLLVDFLSRTTLRLDQPGFVALCVLRQLSRECRLIRLAEFSPLFDPSPC